MSAPIKISKGRHIFDPKSATLPAGCEEFAQSPQALVFEDYVRVYFSSRRKDGAKYLSQVLYVDFDLNFEKLLNVASEPVISLGELGTFDEHGIFPMNVVRVNDSIYGFTTGWSRRISVSVETSIGLTVSRDNGRTFARMGSGPVLGPSLNEPFLVGDGYVKKIGDDFHMWYIFGTAWKHYQEGESAERTYKIGHAISKNGVDWIRTGRAIIPDQLGADESQALPTVIERNGLYHMFFCFRQSSDFRKNPARAYRLGYAWSRDLNNWVRADEAVDFTPSEWDSEMQCYPNIFELKKKVYLLYNGNEFGRRGFGLAEVEL